MAIDTRGWREGARLGVDAACAQQLPPVSLEPSIPETCQHAALHQMQMCIAAQPAPEPCLRSSAAGRSHPVQSHALTALRYVAWISRNMNHGSSMHKQHRTCELKLLHGCVA
jgi:hypothetical protein